MLSLHHLDPSAARGTERSRRWSLTQTRTKNERESKTPSPPWSIFLPCFPEHHITSFFFCFPEFPRVGVPTFCCSVSQLSLPTPLVNSSSPDGFKWHLYVDHSQMYISGCLSLQIYIVYSLFYNYTHVYDGYLKLTYLKLNSRSYLSPP